jgi:hypothetical protein
MMGAHALHFSLVYILYVLAEQGLLRVPVAMT